MIILFLEKYWKQIVGTLVILVLLYSGYNLIYNRGVEAATAKYEQRLKERDDILAKQSEEISKLSSTQAATTSLILAKSEENLHTILSSVKNKPLYKIVDGKCAPSEEFSKAYSTLLVEGAKK